MAQSIYSLLLQECLVQAVDFMAEEKQMSRSQVINEILSERFEMFTPEYKSNHIMDVVKERLSTNEKLHLVSFSKGSSIQYRMVVPYKYKPKIRLMMIMNSKDNNTVATLKISSRTTNKTFSEDLWGFFDALNQVTKTHARLEDFPMVLQGFSRQDDGIYKPFTCRWTGDDYTIEEIARQLTNYLYMMSEVMVNYFDHLNEPDFGREEIERVIHKYF